MICTHVPGSTIPSNGTPARLSPINRNFAPAFATSAARTANPSRVERLNGG